MECSPDVGDCPRCKTMKGGAPERVIQLINEAVLTPTIVNESSKFVVITYWWGKTNMNKNLQRPCPEDILDPLKWQMEEELAEKDDNEGWGEVYKTIGELRKKKQEQPLDEEETAKLSQAVSDSVGILRSLFARPDIKEDMNARYNAEIEKLKTEGKFTEPKTFADMIKHWEETMAKANCNYMATNIEFERGDYQNAINGKPLFIKRALDTLKAMPGKEDWGVLYIDGDMDIHKYPAIFDTPNVDFMARGWNVDPRDNRNYNENICFDPYIFETSGGTMYFGNTQTARMLLDSWMEASSDPKQVGKADDRILSMVFTQRKYALQGSVIQLPIEYLWLTDKYAKRFDGEEEDARHSEAIIEHPACLTGEERAADQGAAANRYPVGYEVMEESTRCETRGGVFYEYIAFPNEAVKNEMGRYLGYLRKATNFETGEPLFEIVKFEHGYGRYTGVAKKNEQEATKLMASLDDEKEVTLAQDASIPEILAHLMKGHNVYIGGVPKKMPLSDDIEFVGRNLGDENDPFHKKLDLDVNSPMLIKSKNPIVIHLLKMCETLADINTHLDESYMFLSRIRWLLSSYVEEIAIAKQLAKTSAKNPFAEELPSLPSTKPRRRRTGGRMTSKRATQRQKRI
jgi:hypothetical protein